MKRTFVSLVTAAQIFGGAAFAQTAAATADGAATYGQDWSLSLGSSVFSDAEMTTLRMAEELKTQWTTLSADDQEMLRRDCDRRGQASTGLGQDSAASETATTGDSADPSTGADTTATPTEGRAETVTESEGTSMADGTISLSAAQLDEICMAIEGL